MIYLSGRTFEHREVIKRFGGWWSATNTRWQFESLTTGQIETLQQCVGVIINQNERPARDGSRRYSGLFTIDEQRNRDLARLKIMIGDDHTYHGEFRDGDPMIYAGFSSLGKFVDYVASLKMPLTYGDGHCDIGWTGSAEHTGTESLAHALQIARDGWLDGLGLADSLLPPDPLAKRRVRAVAGGRVNVGRMLAGDPKHMVRRIAQPHRKIITLFVETVMWIGIDINTAIIRVIAVAAMIDRLEQMGYQCNLIAVYSSRQKDTFRGMQTVVHIKDAGERLNIADVSFAFGHPSFGRRLVFAHEGVIAAANLEHESRGFIDQAFTANHPPPRNSFYIPQIRYNTTDVWEMLELIKPDGLPIEIKPS